MISYHSRVTFEGEEGEGSPRKRHRGVTSTLIDGLGVTPLRVELKDSDDLETYLRLRREIHVLEERPFEMVVRFRCDDDVLSRLHLVNAFANCVALTLQPREIDDSYAAEGVISFGGDADIICFPQLQSLTIKYQPVRSLVLDPIRFPRLKRLSLDYTCNYPLERVAFANLTMLEYVDMRNLLISDGVGLTETLTTLSMRYPSPVIEKFALMIYFSGIR